MSKAGCQAGAVIVASLVLGIDRSVRPRSKDQSSREAARSHRLQRRAVGRWRRAVGVTRDGRRFLDLRDGHAGSRHRLGGPGGERQGRRDGVRQPGRDDQPGPLAAAGRYRADRRRRALQPRRRHHGCRRQRRQCVRGDPRRVVLLRPERDAGLQARLLERLLYRRGVAIRGQLVGALLRPEGRVADPWRRHQRRLPGQRLALDRRRSLRPL